MISTRPLLDLIMSFMLRSSLHIENFLDLQNNHLDRLNVTATIVSIRFQSLSTLVDNNSQRYTKINKLHLPLFRYSNHLNSHLKLDILQRLHHRHHNVRVRILTSHQPLKRLRQDRTVIHFNRLLNTLHKLQIIVHSCPHCPNNL